MRLVLGTVVLLCAASLASQRAGAQSVSEPILVEIGAAGDSFTMGDGPLGPNAALSFTYDFFISKYPITNSQFARFVDEGGYSERSCWTANGWIWKGRITQPAFWKDVKFNGPDQPVVGVSWYEAVAYCNWLSLRAGLSPAYDDSGRADLGASGYRLPTEAEWEYAAAKGAPGQAERVYPWGDLWDANNAVCRIAPSKASRTASVGSRSPQGDTPQGLADLSGNVWEWCSDSIQGEGEIAKDARSDRYHFRGDSASEYMVLRGGSWTNNFQNGFRAAFRGFAAVPGSRHNVSGFRIVRR
jgi:formylglycine-generating enzyme required for sulfatase activity